MHQDLPNGIAVNIKDKLRGLRHALRRTRDSGGTDTPFTTGHPPLLPEIVLNRAAHAAATVIDKAFSTAETISISLVSDNPALHDDAAPEVQSLQDYFSGSAEGQRAFHRDMYYLTKYVLRRHKADNALIQEAAFMAVYTNLKQHHHAQITRLNAPDTDMIRASAALCSILLRQLLRSQPVRLSGTVSKPVLTSCFAATSLIFGLATAKSADMAGQNNADYADNLDSALLATEARFERFLAALEQKDDAELQTLFATLISHLP